MGALKSACLWLVVTLLCSPVLLSIFPVTQVFDGFDPASMKGKRVLICGASSGIGEEMAYHYAKMGAHIALLARRQSLLDKVAGEATKRGAASASAIVADLASHNGLVAAMEKVLALPDFAGKLDVLVLNHAIQRWGWFLPDSETLKTQDIGGVTAPWDFEFVDTSVSVNFMSFVKLAVMGMPALVRGAQSPSPSIKAITATNRISSHIIVVSSGAGKLAVPKAAIYSGAKHGLHGFFDSLRLEMEDKRLPVTITTCIVGQIETETATTLLSGADKLDMPMARVDDTALALIRGGAAGLEEIYTPLDQGLQIVAILRPLRILRHMLDRLNLWIMGGRNVYLS